MAAFYNPRMLCRLAIIATAFSLCCAPLAHSAERDLSRSIQADYDDRLKTVFEDFHAHPELSLAEFRTAEKLAKALRNHGFTVTENVGGTGIVAILKNGEGPLVMMRADMDGLPIEEKSGLDYASRSKPTGSGDRQHISGYARLWSRRTYHQPDRHRQTDAR